MLSSVGKEHHHAKRVPARLLDLAAGAALLGDPDRLKLVFLHRGNAVLAEGAAAEALVSPAAALVGNAGPVALSPGPGAAGEILFFHPEYLNAEFTFEELARPTRLTRTGWEDRFLLRHWLGEAGLRARIAQLEALSAQRLAGFLDRLRTELVDQPDDFWPCRSRSYFLQILLILDQVIAAQESAAARARAAAPPVPAPQALPWASASTSDDSLRPIVAYLVGHCHEALSIAALARTFATNRTTLQARFKKGTGLSVGQYVIRLRVQIAALLLRDTSLTVAEIMERTGFNDPSHFARTFRRHTDRSPSDFRALFKVPRYILA